MDISANFENKERRDRSFSLEFLVSSCSDHMSRFLTICHAIIIIIITYWIGDSFECVLVEGNEKEVVVLQTQWAFI